MKEYKKMTMEAISNLKKGDRVYFKYREKPDIFIKMTRSKRKVVVFDWENDQILKLKVGFFSHFFYI